MFSIYVGPTLTGLAANGRYAPRNRTNLHRLRCVCSQKDALGKSTALVAELHGSKETDCMGERLQTNFILVGMALQDVLSSICLQKPQLVPGHEQTNTSGRNTTFAQVGP